MANEGHTEEQIIAALQQAEAGGTTMEICRKLGISTGDIYKWRKQYAGLGVQELRELRQSRRKRPVETHGCRSVTRSGLTPPSTDSFCTYYGSEFASRVVEP